MARGFPTLERNPDIRRGGRVPSKWASPKAYSGPYRPDANAARNTFRRVPPNPVEFGRKAPINGGAARLILRVGARAVPAAAALVAAWEIGRMIGDKVADVINVTADPTPVLPSSWEWCPGKAPIPGFICAPGRPFVSPGWFIAGGSCDFPPAHPLCDQGFFLNETHPGLIPATETRARWSRMHRYSFQLGNSRADVGVARRVIDDSEVPVVLPSMVPNVREDEFEPLPIQNPWPAMLPPHLVPAETAPVPWRAIPDLAPNPALDPDYQRRTGPRTRRRVTFRPGVGVPAPQPGADPLVPQPARTIPGAIVPGTSVVVEAVPGARLGPGTPVRSTPAPSNGPERKFRAPGVLAAAMRVGGAATEAQEFIDALYKNLPARRRDRKHTPLERWQVIYDYWSEIDIEGALLQVAEDNIKDMLIGAASGTASQGLRDIGVNPYVSQDTGGVGRGFASMAEARAYWDEVRAQQRRRRAERRLDKQRRRDERRRAREGGPYDANLWR